VVSFVFSKFKSFFIINLKLNQVFPEGEFIHMNNTLLTQGGGIIICGSLWKHKLWGECNFGTQLSVGLVQTVVIKAGARRKWHDAYLNTST